MDNHDEETLSLTFWGVRGSIPAPGQHTLRYGGETTCLEVRAGPHTVVVDLGSGARAAGTAFTERGIEHLDVIFTHTHMDHICGLPFFRIAYDPSVEVNLWAGHIPPGGSLEEIVERMMSPPIFPVATSALRNTNFRSFKAGEPITLVSGLTLRTQRLNHPGNATGYRIDWCGSSIAIITDHEHGDAQIDAEVAAFVKGADVMVYDAMYLEEEYDRFVGWGHSTPEKALKLATDAGVAAPVLFHHDPCRTDDALDDLRNTVIAKLPNAEVAREGTRFVLRRGRILESPAMALAQPVP
ncbi:MAG: MBL fold metallo-hydrolase [Pseudomonadota bacterium]